MKPTEVRPIDQYFQTFNQTHQNKTNRIIQCICLPLLLFSIIGLAWAIPFPHLGFLGTYNGYINWASILIAVLIYYYLKLSPMLSYVMLLILFAFSYGIIELQQWEGTGGPALAFTSVTLLIIAVAGLIIGQRKEKLQHVLVLNWKLLLIGPLWLIHLLLKKANIKY
ncbi:DUF962 domain-containing protein [Mucilaginibacter robiniae]|uniref:DUF962 domain-containing protein n=1 Tax=Mucilaginibacter robiniae TaxID=2728022 RepID=A0A7L5E1Z0_9SPHI|nr:Mpo1-like protein [Mucilaginibacter robiniae]QJD97362.1 DUF962 domain-containing protein [Mucilaginibacter robiniae]